MSQIEVPDWVVELAQQAYYEHDDTGSCQYAMLKAITAALGAWVVPAHFATDGAGDVPVFEEFTELDQAYGHAGDDGWVVEAYVLRQEKPE